MDVPDDLVYDDHSITYRLAERSEVVTCGDLEDWRRRSRRPGMIYIYIYIYIYILRLDIYMENNYIKLNVMQLTDLCTVGQKSI